MPDTAYTRSWWINDSPKSWIWINHSFYSKLVVTIESKRKQEKWCHKIKYWEPLVLHSLLSTFPCNYQRPSHLGNQEEENNSKQVDDSMTEGHFESWMFKLEGKCSNQRCSCGPQICTNSYWKSLIYLGKTKH